MARGATRFGGLRAITAVVALYALVLQSFLGGLMPAAMATGGPDPLCVSGPASAAPADPEKAPASRQHHECCVAACVAATVAAPAPLSTDVVWPARRAARVSWSPEARPSARAPPRSIAHPRGPPSA